MQMAKAGQTGGSTKRGYDVLGNVGRGRPPAGVTMSATASGLTYTAHLVETSDPTVLPVLAEKYTQLRIKGLQQSPHSFSATLEGEQAIEQKEKLERISIPNKHIVVVVAQEKGANAVPWYENEWVAQATLYGPNTWKQHTHAFHVAHPNVSPLTNEELERTSLAPAERKDTTAFWHMTALYVDANHRRRGLANQLCLFTFDVIKRTSAPIQQAELRIFVKPTNLVVVGMYAQLGFVTLSGNEGGMGAPYVTLSEAAFVAGDMAMLPDDYAQQSGFTTRAGLIMAKSLDHLSDVGGGQEVGIAIVQDWNATVR